MSNSITMSSVSSKTLSAFHQPSLTTQAETRSCSFYPRQHPSWTSPPAGTLRRELRGRRSRAGRVRTNLSLSAQCSVAPPSAATASRSTYSSPLLDMVPTLPPHLLPFTVAHFDPLHPSHFDLLVVGAGPAGLSVAQQVAAAGLAVGCVDPNPNLVWPNNYGVWVDEFEALGLEDCLDYQWKRAVVYLDDERKKTLERPYGRVNRERLKSKVLQSCIRNGVQFHVSKVVSVQHGSSSSTVTCQDGVQISASLVLDASGFSQRLIRYDQPCQPGFQVAWGMVAEVDSHPFDVDEMLFMDWRDSHLPPASHIKARNQALPTFLYAMPFSPTRIFLEETSLVARPALSFEECQQRLELRLQHLGIRVRSIEEDEYCLIPMGGVLPAVPQRVLGIGGTAGMVHPSTGYMVARTMAAAPEVSEAIVRQLRRRGSMRREEGRGVGGRGEGWGGEREKAVGERQAAGGGGELSVAVLEAEAATGAAAVSAVGGEKEGRRQEVDADEMARQVWEAIWPRRRVEQREFFCFGMDVLLRLDLSGNRRFFDAFFDLEAPQWQGFLSSRLYLVELLSFGLSLFSKATNKARLEIVVKGVPGLVVLIRNLVTRK